MYYRLYNCLLSRIGFGGRVSKGIWEQQYGGNTWDYLSGEEEAAHYKAIIKQVKQYSFSPSILDIGCGHGVLFSYLKNEDGLSLQYKGIDLSDNATKKASAQYPNVKFETVDYDFENVEGKYSIIIFNETLYYFLKPLRTLGKAVLENLVPGGIVIISMCDDHKHDLIWKNISKHYEVIDTAKVQNAKSQHWEVKTIKPLNAQL